MNAWNPPLFLRDDLGRLAASARPGADAASLSRGLLVGYGRCVVHDVPAQPPPALTPDAALVGATALTREVEQAAADIEASLARWHDAGSRAGSAAVVAGLLELRMDAWYGAEALERLAATAGGDQAGRLRAAVKPLDAAAHAYSAALEDNVDVLSTAAATPLLRNWRAMLPPRLDRYEPLPWWLDGTLEVAALKLAREFDSSPAGRGDRPDAAPMPRPPEDRAAALRDDPLRRASVALAAAGTGRGVTALHWTLPGTSLHATMYVPPTLAGVDHLTLELEDAAGGTAAIDAVGTLSLLNGIPVCWSLGGTADRPTVVATWPWTGAEQLSADGMMALVDAQSGLEWTAADPR